MKKVELLYRQKVEDDVRDGMTCEAIVKKYPVSMYYARKWSGEVYRKADLNHLVRDRYKWLVNDALKKILEDIEDSIGGECAAGMPDDVWDIWDDKIRQRLYELAKEIVRKN